MLQEDLSPINLEVDEAINDGLNCVFNELNVTARKQVDNDLI